MPEYKPNVIERFSTWVLGNRPPIDESVPVKERKIQAEHGKGINEFVFNKANYLNGGFSTKILTSRIRSYFQWYGRDSTVRSGINSLVEDSVGLGYHTVMPIGYEMEYDEDDEPITPPEKELVDEFGRIQKLDQFMPNVIRLALIAGFCPVETKITKFPAKSKLKIIHPATVEEIHADSDGKFDYLIQRINSTKTEKFTSKEITLFVYNQMGNDYSGLSLVATVENLLTIKHSALNNMEGMIERYISPLYIWLTTGDITPVKNALEHRNSGEDIFLGNLDLDEFEQFKAQPIEVKGDSKFSEFINFVDQLIWIGINSPNQMYWRNATEASAKVLEDMMDKSVYAIERGAARAMEEGFFERLLITNGYNPSKDNNVPRVEWGVERTGTEDLMPSEIIAKGIDMFYIQEPEFWDLMNQMGMKVKPRRPMKQEPEEEPDEEEPILDPDDEEPQTDQDDTEQEYRRQLQARKLHILNEIERKLNES